jgi:RNA recognition motif-containing protein
MSAKIHISGLSYFCTDDTLRQAFIPFGTVVLAQVLRDEWGHSLGLGIIHMARSEDVERVFNEQQRFEVAGSRVDLWEPAEPEHPQGKRTVGDDLRGRQTEQTGHEQEAREEPQGAPTIGSPRAPSRPDSGVLFPDRQTLTTAAEPISSVHAINATPYTG